MGALKLNGQSPPALACSEPPVLSARLSSVYAWIIAVIMLLLRWASRVLGRCGAQMPLACFTSSSSLLYRRKEASRLINLQPSLGTALSFRDTGSLPLSNIYLVLEWTSIILGVHSIIS